MGLRTWWSRRRTDAALEYVRRQAALTESEKLIVNRVGSQRRITPGDIAAFRWRDPKSDV